MGTSGFSGSDRRVAGRLSVTLHNTCYRTLNGSDQTPTLSLRSLRRLGNVPSVPGFPLSPGFRPGFPGGVMLVSVRAASTRALRRVREGRGTPCVADASEIKSLGHPPVGTELAGLPQPTAQTNRKPEGRSHDRVQQEITSEFDDPKEDFV